MSRLAGRTIVVAAAEPTFAAGVVAALQHAGGTVVVAAPASLALDLPGGCDRRDVDPDDESGWAALFASLTRESGRPDGLVTLAAETPALKLADTTLDAFRAATGDTVDLVFAANRAAVLAMRDGLAAGEVASGAIVNVCSFAAHVGLAHGAMLNAVAAGIWNLSRQIGIETGENGERIRVNSVHVGPSARQAAALGIDSRYVVEAAHDVAEAVVYLLSDEARLVTAADITIDRGLTSGIGR